LVRKRGRAGSKVVGTARLISAADHQRTDANSVRSTRRSWSRCKVSTYQRLTSVWPESRPTVTVEERKCGVEISRPRGSTPSSSTASRAAVTVGCSSAST
jgi:hypothetical protein